MAGTPAGQHSRPERPDLLPLHRQAVRRRAPRDRLTGALGWRVNATRPPVRPGASPHAAGQLSGSRARGGGGGGQPEAGTVRRRTTAVRDGRGDHQRGQCAGLGWPGDPRTAGDGDGPARNAPDTSVVSASSIWPISASAIGWFNGKNGIAASGQTISAMPATLSLAGGPVVCRDNAR